MDRRERCRETILTVSGKNNNTLTGRSRKNPSKIHSLPVTEVREDWEALFNRKLMTKSKIQRMSRQYENGQIFY